MNEDDPEISALSNSSCMIGRDRLGWIFLGQLAYAAQELAQKHKPALADADQDALRLSRATDIAIWGTFNLAS